MLVTIIDKKTGETLPGAVITIGDRTSVGQTNENGQVDIGAGSYTARMIGYEPKPFNMPTATVELTPQPIELGEVIIQDTRPVKVEKWGWLVVAAALILLLKKK